MQSADLTKSKAILGFTTRGGTVLRIAKYRPNVPVIAVCYDIRTARWLALVWGVYGITIPQVDGDFDFSTEIRKACSGAVAKGFADPDQDVFTITAGLPWGVVGTTNIVRVVSAAGPEYWFDGESHGKMVAYEHTKA